MPELHKLFGLKVHRFRRVVMVVQILATAVALACVPGNAAKLAVMLVVWAIGFGRIKRTEFALMACINAIFILMDIATLKQGAFRFTSPNLLGLPYYEFLIWGFYVLNAIRFIGANPPQGSATRAIGWIVLFALPFALIQDYRLLFLASAVFLAIGLGLFHKSRDIAFVGYMIGMGAIIEYTGVRSGQWTYDGPTLGGVPLWFAPMWGGVGLFVHRLGLPLMGYLGRLGKTGRLGAERIQ
jgi:hypothetical protein